MARCGQWIFSSGNRRAAESAAGHAGEEVQGALGAQRQERGRRKRIGKVREFRTVWISICPHGYDHVQLPSGESNITMENHHFY